MNDVTVIIPIFGDDPKWLDLAARAQSSAWHQSVEPVSVVVSTGASLSQARNVAADAARTEWLCFLDADDELAAGYIEAMLAGTGDLRQPATLGVSPDGLPDDAAVLIPPLSLLEGNYIVIGAFVRTEMFQQVGGFDELPMYEDWDLWIRCWLAGAEITACPEAVYRVHATPGSRNNQHQGTHVATYNEIHNRYRGLTPAVRS